MKLLYTLTAYPPSIGGAQLHQHMLAQQFKLRHKLQVVSQWDTNRSDWLLGTTVLAPRQARDYTIDGIPVHRIGLSVREKLSLVPYAAFYYAVMNQVLPSLSRYYEKYLRLYAQDTDLIHNVRIGREAFSYASFAVARQRDVPFVLTPLHHPRWVGWRYRAYLKLYTLADVVIALTRTEKEILQSLGVQENRVVVTGMGPVLADLADPSAFLSRYNIAGPVILFLGQHYGYKGYRQLLQASPLVWKRIPEAHFIFIGPAVGASEKVFEVIHDKRILRLGELTLQEKTDALAACTLLCVPSTQESFGGVYTEAWSFGKPVIGCNIPAVSEVIQDTVDGFLVRQKPKEIARRICELLLDPGLARRMGEFGKKKVQTKYTWEKIAASTEAAYAMLLKGTQI